MLMVPLDPGFASPTEPTSRAHADSALSMSSGGWTTPPVAAPLVLRGGFLEGGVEELAWTALGHVGWSVHWVRMRFPVVQDEVRVEEKGPGWLGWGFNCLLALVP